jgi:hypothetical protein
VHFLVEVVGVFRAAVLLLYVMVPCFGACCVIVLVSLGVVGFPS